MFSVEWTWNMFSVISLPVFSECSFLCRFSLFRHFFFPTFAQICDYCCCEVVQALASSTPLFSPYHLDSLADRAMQGIRSSSRISASLFSQINYIQTLACLLNPLRLLPLNSASSTFCGWLSTTGFLGFDMLPNFYKRRWNRDLISLHIFSFDNGFPQIKSKSSREKVGFWNSQFQFQFFIQS